MNNLHLLEIAKSLAVELSAADFPHLWRMTRSRGDWWQELKTDDAWLMIQENGGRLVIASDRPRQMKTAGNAERITCSLERTPQAIAQDITRRLLPNAREYFARCREYTRNWQKEQEDHTEILHMLEPFTQWKRTDSDGVRTEWRSARATADIYTDRAYWLKIADPTVDEILQILRILETTRKE
jgi:hypothetical protein